MSFRHSQSVSVLLAAVITLVTLFGADRIACQVLAEPTSDCEEVKTDAEVDDVDDLESVAHECLSPTQSMAASAIAEAGDNRVRLLRQRQIPPRAPPV